MLIAWLLVLAGAGACDVGVELSPKGEHALPLSILMA